MYVLPPLPYDPAALAPTISGDTLRTHHGKHHKRYVDVTNEMLKGDAARPLEAVVREAAAGGSRKLYNNAAQAWNHAFFWRCMTPQRADPSAALAEALGRDLGGLQGLRDRFLEEGVNHFASGWAWLITRDGRLEVVSTHDAGSFDQLDGAPLLVCDVWEHAYYLDYKNDRKSFVEAWFDRVVDWTFVDAQLRAAQAGEPGWRYPPPTA